MNEPGACRVTAAGDARRQPAAATPSWMARRLERSGVEELERRRGHYQLRDAGTGPAVCTPSISQKSRGITVRYARKGEELLLLNDKKLALMPGLAGNSRRRKAAGAGPESWAGRKARSAAQTRDMFLESAFFSPEAIAGKPRMVGFATDSSAAL